MCISKTHFGLVCWWPLALGACSTPADRTPEPLPARLSNRLGMDLVLIPAGTFTMGNTETLESMRANFGSVDEARLHQLDDETPAHRVTLPRPFYMAQHEVTVGQFRRSGLFQGRLATSRSRWPMAQAVTVKSRHI